MLEEKLTAIGERLTENDTAALPALLTELRQLFEHHVSVEKEQLYPPLHKKAEAAGQQGQLLLAKSFDDGMNVITGAMTRFLAKYEAAASINPDAFTQDWNTILHALRSRFQAEEVSLYPMFRRLVR